MIIPCSARIAEFVSDLVIADHLNIDRIQPFVLIETILRLVKSSSFCQISAWIMNMENLRLVSTILMRWTDYLRAEAYGTATGFDWKIKPVVPESGLANPRLRNFGVYSCAVARLCAGRDETLGSCLSIPT